MESPSFPRNSAPFSSPHQEQEQQQQRKRRCLSSDDAEVNQKRVKKVADWVLTNYNCHTTNSPSVEHEFQRLRILRTLPVVSEPAGSTKFQKYAIQAATAALLLLVGSRSAPMGRISVVDLGQTRWIGISHAKSQHAENASTLPSIKPLTSVPRRHSICAHTILSKTGVLVVPDLSKDDRFANHPEVMQQGFRFYAGVVLMVDGVAVGTVSVVDTLPREAGFLTEELEKSLQSIAQEIVKDELNNRNRCQLSTSTEKEHQVTVTTCAGKVLPTSATPPVGSNLRDLVLASRDSSALLQFSNVRRLESQQRAFPTSTTTTPTSTAAVRTMSLPTLDKMNHGYGSHSLSNGTNLPVPESSSRHDVVRGLELVAQIVPKHVNITIHSSKDLQHVKFQETLVFRSASVILTSACQRTLHGSVTVNLIVDDKKEWLTVECEDTAGTVLTPEVFELPLSSTANDADSLCMISDRCFSVTGKLIVVKSCRSNNETLLNDAAATTSCPNFYAVACCLQQMKGEVGVRPRTPSNKDDRQVGSVVWIRAPILR